MPAEPGRLELGLALALSSVALETGLAHWLSPVTAGHFDSVWSLESPLSDQAEPLVWLAAAASLAPSAGVGTAALIAPVRNPVLLARQLATLDHLTNGRLTVGVTIGRRRADYDLTGTDYTKRGRILDETLHTLRALWSDQPLEVRSPFWTLESSDPVGLRPFTPGGPPLLVGGHAERALHRAATLADGYLAGATSGPAHALTTRKQIAGLLDQHDRDIAEFQFVANVFVHLAPNRSEAIAVAAEIFEARHGGPPPYDPETVVVGGTAAEVAETIEELHAGGYDGINLVPVAMTVHQVEALAGVSELLAYQRR